MAHVLICVTHLLGTGHLSRALTLARAFAGAGHDAHVMSGGMPAPNLSRDGVAFHQLPPVKSDGVNFTDLLHETGAVDSDYLADRKQAALGVLAAVAPDVFITELYPFGRRVLKGEFLSLLNTARGMAPKPLIYSSIRDILAPPSKPKKAQEAEAVLMGYYDGVLVHSDVDITSLDASWPVSDMLAKKLRYTGFVAPPVAGVHPDGAGQDEVLVTAGGGDVGMALFRAALEVATLDPDTQYRVLVGGTDGAKTIAELQASVASTNVVVEPTRPDFRQMLTGARAAICMCGYNTAMDVLQSQTPSVFVPFDAGGEVEQTLRAKSLAERDGFAMIKASDVTPEGLLQSLQEVIASPPHAVNLRDFDGAATAVSIVEKGLESIR